MAWPGPRGLTCTCVCLISTENVSVCAVPVCPALRGGRSHSSPPSQPLVPFPPLWAGYDTIHRTQLWGGLLAGPTTLGQTGIEEAIQAQHILTPTPTSLFHRDAEAR